MLRLRISKLTRAQRTALLVAAPLVAGIRIGLWMLPGSVVLRLVSRLARRPASASSSRITNRAEIVWAVEAIGRRIPGATCLTQAIAAKLLLDLAGDHAQFCLGVAHTPAGSLRAHAWLEQNGRALLGGAGIQSLVRLPELPRSANASPPPKLSSAEP
ncbi:MAG TPA: lasso peptide biosynthesis B2 protein [Gemmatimonadaceae bacterium]|nr:lasso peptide biosynthesis B2 protein [Gemmatimonadaceae bacterium]